MAIKTGSVVLVRSYAAGVHFGKLKSRNGADVTLTGARRIWRWEGANTLSEIALHGVAQGSRISEAVTEIILPGVCEVIEVSPKAARVLAKQGWDK